MGNNINLDDRKLLLSLSRKTIEKKEKKMFLTENEISSFSSTIKEKRGGFVTLTIDKKLRGCIGYILPIYPLYQTVIENSYNAAYSDPRFSPVSDNEIKNLHIEISALSVPKKLIYKDGNDLISKLNPLVDGVIIKKGFYSSTFLPQVWEQLPDKKDFLNHLCMKAGLSSDEWEKGFLEVEIYNAEVIEE